MARVVQPRRALPSIASFPKPSSAISIALVYGVLSALWILFSGKLLHHMVQDAATAAHFENVKGWFFVAVTAVLLWLTLDRYFAQIRGTARKLEEGEKRWRDAIEGAGDGVWDWDVLTGRVFYSRQWKAMLGYEPHEIGETATEWETRVHPDDLARVTEDLRRLLVGETTSYATEHRVRCKDGSYKWVLDRGKVASRTGDGKPLRVIGTHTDIAERKRAEAAVRESEARYRGLFEAETDAVLVVDQHSDEILDANPAALALYGYTRDEMLALRSLQLSAEPEASQAAIAAREGFVASRMHRRKDGSTFPIEASRSYFELQGRAVHVAAFRDISERQHAAAALRESDERLRRLGDNLPESYIYQAILEPDGRRHFTHVSAGVETLHGLTPAQVVEDASRLTGLINQAQAGAFAVAEERSARDLSDFAIELEMSHPTRGARVIQVRSRPHRTASGQVVWDGVATDITERRAALDAMRQRLELQHQLAKVAETVPGMIFSFRRRPDGTFCLPFATPAIEPLFGVKAEDVRDDFSPAISRIHKSDRERVQESIARSAHTMEPWRDTFRVQHPLLGEIWLEGNSLPRREPDGSVLWHGFVQDVTERKRAEMEAREREQQLRLFVEHSPAAIAMFDRDMRYLVLSRRWLMDYRLADRSIVGLSHYDVFPDIPERWKAIHRRCLAGAVERCEADPFPRQDGTLDWVRWEVRPWQTARDEIGGLLVFSEVITARIQAEQTLAMEATRRRILIEGSSDGIVVLNEEGGVHEANARFADMLGYSAEEVRNLHVWEWDSSWSRERVVEAIQVLPPGGDHFESRHTRKDGSVFDVDLVTSPGEIGGRKLVFCVCHDISLRKRAEADLQHSEQRFRTLVESAPIGVFVQADGRFAYVNAAAVLLFGAHASDELVGQSVVERFDPLVRAQVADRIHRLNHERLPVPPAEERCLRLDGEGFDAEFSAVPLDVDGRAGALVFFQDITGRKRLEAQLRQAQKLEGVGQLAGGIAHDFNNILAAILMHLGIMRAEAGANQELRAGLLELESHTQRAASLTRQLLMFSRRSVLSMAPLNVNEVTANLLKMLRRLIGETIVLRFDGCDALPSVEADGGMLDQVLMNLVVNARDAMPHGGTIDITTSVVEIRAAEVAANPERRAGAFICLSVADTGCGMSPEIVKQIFDPFFTTKEPGKGTGLGLATVHGIVKQHRGWMEVESAVGRGSLFRVYLPALSTPAPTTAAPGQVMPVRRGSEGVLVVEDDAMLRNLTAHSLRLLGYRVYEVGNGQEAMHVWQVHASDVDLLLTDMVMPEGVTGLELAERLQSAKPGLRVILTSGYSAEISRAGVPNKPGMLYLPKPFDVSALAGAVGKMLGAANKLG